MHVVIIGNGVAGINAANVLRSRDETARITIISCEHDHFFSRTALMYVFCGQLSERCVEPYERDYYDTMNFERVRDRVVRLDSQEKRLHLESGSSITYDRLLIASGSVPVMAPWPGVDLDGVGNFVTWQNMQWLKERSPDVRRAVVVGGGLIGVEIAEILRQSGINVTFLVREKWFWPIALDHNEGTVIAGHMQEHAVDLRLHTEMKEILGENGRVVGVRTTEGDNIDCELVMIAIGVRPQTDFLDNCKIKLDERGGIIVDDQLRTNLPDVWAAGDCTSVVWFNGVRRPEQLWYTGRDQGSAAGHNLAGDQRVYHRGTFYNSAKFFDVEYTTAGLVNFKLDGEQNWYQHEPGTNRTTRITYLADNTIAGFNALGRRWDHRVLVQWIEQKRTLDWTIAHLHEALYDEELMPPFRLLSTETK
ncbi:MAG: NAD(P)/FAD-dependent oxidoreductase [Candidatus Zixiibacteriota bacterium]